MPELPPCAKTKRPSFWVKLALLISLFLALTGLLRVFGAWRSMGIWQAQGLAPGILIYLAGAGLAQFALAGAVFLSLRQPRQRGMRWVWACSLGMLLLYWVERLAFWQPAERGGNILFILLLQSLGLGLLGLISLQELKKES